jgi:flagellar biosynthesis protein
MEKHKKAIALTYDENYNAPIVSAKGIGYVADNIIKEAEKNQVPVILDEDMANFLISTDIGDYIPEELYQTVAEILVFIMDIDSKAIIPQK